MEQQQEGTGVSRGQNQLHLLPEDPSAAAAALTPLLDRLDAGTKAAQMLVITSDGEAAASIAARLGGGDGPRVVAATEGRRAARVLKQGAAPVLVAPADILAELQRAAVLKLDAVRVVVFAWVTAERGQEQLLETVMADVPKEAARIVLASSQGAAVDALIERYAWRARRMQAAGAEELPVVSLSYVVTSEHGRASALRRTLDALDPDSAYVVVRDPASRAEAESLLRSLGYGAGASDAVRVGEKPEGPAALVVLYDLPAREDDLRAIGGSHGAARLVALVTGRQLDSLRSLAGGAVTPLTLPDAAVRARSRDERARDELREVLSGGQFSREVLTLEPLLADHDGIEIAAAALRLLEAERAKARAPQLQGQPATVTRLYLNVGAMDEVRPGDLVGAITNQAGISKAELGRVDVRDRHSTVEVASSVANAVVAKITGIEIRGRRVIARVDDDKPRERPKRVGGERGERGERRGPSRGGPGRGGPGRGDRPDRPRPTRDRPPR